MALTLPILRLDMLIREMPTALASSVTVTPRSSIMSSKHSRIAIVLRSQLVFFLNLAAKLKGVG